MTRSSTSRNTSTAALRAAQGSWELTDTHVRLLELLSRGYTLRRAARVLGVSVNTAKTQVRRLYARLGADNAAHAVRRGFERGLLRPDASGTNAVEKRPT